jgi:choice-of-anchor B domain-containing protein
MQNRMIMLLLAFAVASPLFAQLNAELVGHLEYDEDMSNLWGWTDDDGNEYVIAGTYDGTSIVDISDPTSPVEIQFIDGANSTWRQMCVWDDYCYVVNETSDGLLCINLGTIPTEGEAEFTFTDGNVDLETGHILYTDENGIIYVFGPNIYGGSTVMFDASANPMDPPFVGATDTWYVHHGYAENDTLFECNIYQGWMSIWDVSDKSSPELLATQNTPGSFTHNAILMDNGFEVHTTDEVTNGSLASYDITDLDDIDFLGEFRPTPGTNSIPHYAWDFNQFVLTAWYRDGLVVTDMTHPEAVVMTAWYDTSPLTGSGFNGAWGVYPYFPSGVIAVTDIEEGLFLIDVDYVSAAYLDGTVTDASSAAPIFDVTITLTPDLSASTNLIGNYITGTAEAGTYDVTYSKPGYNSYTETGVELVNGETVTVDVELEPLVSFPFTGQVVDVVSGDGIEGADVLVTNPDVSFTAVTDADGNFVIPTLFDGTYSVYAGHWGHITDVEADLDINDGTSVVIELSRGYYDDFLFDFDWVTTSTASSGDWEKGEPVGTSYGASASNPDNDVNDDFGVEAYVTGNGGGDAGSDDVDDGTVILTTPEFDLTGYASPYMTFYRWWFNNGGFGSPDDEFVMTISNGSDEVDITLDDGFTAIAFWIPEMYDLSSLIEPTSTMTVSFRTGDNAGAGHLVEAAIDVFFVFDSLSSAPVAAFETADPSVCTGETVGFTDLSSDAASWNWSFPGGSPATSTVANPSVTYSTPGTYDVSLTVTNALGSNTISLTDYIVVNESPDAVASASAGSATVTVTGGATPYEFLWSDGQTTETATGLSVGSYSVTVTDANGCTAFAEVEVTQPSDIEVYEDGLMVSLYPNPVADQLRIDLQGQGANYMMQVTDPTGKLIMEDNLHNGGHSFDLTKLPGGIYNVRINGEEGTAAVLTFVKL